MTCQPHCWAVIAPYTLMKVRGNAVGDSKIKADKLDGVRELLKRADDKLLLPALEPLKVISPVALAD